MEKHGLSRAEVGCRLGGAATKVSYLLSQLRNPTLDQAEAIANAAGFELREMVSGDFKPGKEKREPFKATKRPATELFVANLNDEIERQEISQSEVARRIEGYATNISAIIGGRQIPTLTYAERVAGGVGFTLARMLSPFADRIQTEIAGKPNCSIHDTAFVILVSTSRRLIGSISARELIRRQTAALSQADGDHATYDQLYRRRWRSVGPLLATATTPRTCTKR
jgi:transcriptional regulator with XRE-family HTH domain